MFKVSTKVVVSPDDSQTQFQIQNAMKELNGEGHTVLSTAFIPPHLYVGDEIRIVLTYCKPDSEEAVKKAEEAKKAAEAKQNEKS